MADHAEIRAGLVANLSQIPDLQVEGYVLSNPTFPTALILAGTTEYDKAMHRGLDDLIFRIRVVVAAVSDIGATVNLDEYMNGSGARSIKAAVEADKTLGGACSEALVTGHSGEQVFTFDDRPPALGTEFTVQIKATGT